MATKWNAFPYRRGTKALAFVLGLLMAAGGVFIAAQTLQKKGIFKEDIFARDFTDTREFSVYVNSVTEKAAQMVQRFISEEAVKDGTAFAPEKKDRLAQLEKDIALRIKECEEEIRQNPGDYETYRYEKSYAFDSEGEITVDTSYIRESYTLQAQEDILNYEILFRQDYARAKATLARVHTLQYAVADKSGRVCTNMDTKDYKEAVEGMPWFVWSEDFYYHSYSAAPADARHLIPSVYNGAAFYVGFDEAAVLASSELDDLGQKAHNFHAFTKTRPMLFAALALLLLLCILDAIYLICVAGRREKGGAVYLRRADRMWNFLHWTLGLGGGLFLAFFEILLIDNAGLYGKHMSISILSALSVFLPLALIGESVLSIARHVKNKTVLKNTPWHKLWQKLRGASAKSMKRSTVLILLGFLAWSLITIFFTAMVTTSLDEAGLLVGAVMALVGVAAAYLLLLKHTSALDEIQHALRQAKQGNLTSGLNPAHMPAGMKSLAEGILNMRQGMDAAVRQAVAGERMRTELITNVSHDLKTPLTSVINYVDLLRREDITEEERGDYLLTLSQKSEQLGRLVEDLVEASKASSGNVELHPVEVNLHELALQAVGENSDALAAQGIELIIQAPEEAPVVWADGQKTWRVVENLMSNVKKYTMPGTRVYLQLAREGGFGGLTVKNISGAPLNIPAQELTQRFVRGDMARSGEGSGLGLSIADSLCKVQGGRFELQIDGDLFKAGVWLPLAGDGHSN
ncbi:MAG: HAMP domain-containing histidine kinase [Firmicutes bacterium]|nr:HAMP domain-containing histidine kinase [Bacillota bacterium]